MKMLFHFSCSEYNVMPFFLHIFSTQIKLVSRAKPPVGGFRKAFYNFLENFTSPKKSATVTSSEAGAASFVHSPGKQGSSLNGVKLNGGTGTGHVGKGKTQSKKSARPTKKTGGKQKKYNPVSVSCPFLGHSNMVGRLGLFRIPAFCKQY